MFDEDEIVDDSLEPETVQTASKNEVDSELGQTRMEVAYGAGDGDDDAKAVVCLLYTSPSPRDGLLSRMPSSA